MAFDYLTGCAKSIQKIITVRIIEKNLSSINPLCNDMVQRSRVVYGGFLGYAIRVSNNSDFAIHKSDVPYIPLEMARHRTCSR
jgi:hypothetical protein